MEKKTKSKDICNDEWWRSGKGYEIWNLSPALCVGLGEACKIYSKEMNAENKSLSN